MRVCEIFKSIQGEGPYQGRPTIFIRLSGCTRQCEWCDTKYHTDYVEMDEHAIMQKIEGLDCDSITFTGGEPLIQYHEIAALIHKHLWDYHIALETNGDMLNACSPYIFDTVVVSPKKPYHNYPLNETFYWKFVVGSVKEAEDVLAYFDWPLQEMIWLQPLTTTIPIDTPQHKQLEQDIWNFCVEHNLNYSPRLHTHVWGMQRCI
jgi:organic radical activating enzyme